MNIRQNNKIKQYAFFVIAFFWDCKGCVVLENRTHYKIAVEQGNLINCNVENECKVESEQEASVLRVTLCPPDETTGSSSCVKIATCDFITVKVLDDAFKGIILEIDYKAFKKGLTYGLFFGGSVNDESKEHAICDEYLTIESLRKANLAWNDVVLEDYDDDDIDVENYMQLSKQNPVDSGIEFKEKIDHSRKRNKNATAYFHLISNNVNDQHTLKIAAKKL